MLMDTSRWLRLLAVAALVGLLGCAALWLTPSPELPANPSPDRPKLVVLVVYDQMRGDYLERWQALFGEGGFRRLMDEGAWFQNCHLPYANTVTAAGHASMLTGCTPSTHGIVANEWYDRAEELDVSSVFTIRYEQLPPPQPPPVDSATGRALRYPSAAPDRLLAPTVGDVLKRASNGQGKVVGLSIKDRAAVLPAGHRSDACYWLDSFNGTFITSTYFSSRLHPWAAEFNRLQPKYADQWFGQDWTHLRPDINYVRHSGIDDQPGEGKGFLQGRVFPHPMTGGAKQPSKAYYNAMYNSPFGNDLLLEFTRRAIDGEQLGADEQPDLLCVSFSCTDSVGHTWGPDSQEVLDVTLRADRVMRGLLDHLDSRVGRGRYVVLLTADHGVCPLPEVSRAQGREADRLSFAKLTTEAADYLSVRFKQPEGSVRWFEGLGHPPFFYLNRPVLAALKLDVAEVSQVLARWLQSQTGIQRAYTRQELEGPRPPEEDERVWKTYHPQRCGEVLAILKPYYIWEMPFEGGTSHGTPHPYDTHVPLLVFGGGVKPGARPEPVSAQAIAAIASQALRIPQPEKSQGTVPAGLWPE
ncbi:MAG: alkaline phosphatase family protein [Planctomycetia bacterium]|nr:alkaline phosphatase family protein [Planctomycetia bacterium]